MPFGIEVTDAILAALLSGKIGADEFFRWRNGAKGKNGVPALGRRLGLLEKKVDDVGEKIDDVVEKIDELREGVREDIRLERKTGEEAHRELHEKINTCATGIAEVKGELKGLARRPAAGG